MLKEPQSERGSKEERIAAIITIEHPDPGYNLAFVRIARPDMTRGDAEREWEESEDREWGEIVDTIDWPGGRGEEEFAKGLSCLATLCDFSESFRDAINDLLRRVFTTGHQHGVAHPDVHLED